MIDPEASERLLLNIEDRAKVIFDEHRRDVYIQGDRLFSWLLPVQWLAAIACAFWISPRAWSGVVSQTHFHVWVAIVLGGIITLFPSFWSYRHPGRVETRYLIGVAQMLIGSLLIHLTGGRIETHFHVFGSLAFLAFYRDWKVLVLATLVVAFDHWVRGVYWPQSVFGIMTPQPWRWLEHAGWVIFEDAFLIYSCLSTKKEIQIVAVQAARDEYNQQLTEAKISERTTELMKAEQALRQSEERHQAVLKTASDAFVGMNSKGLIIDWNDQAERTFGWRRNDILGMPLSDTIIPKQFREAHTSGLANFLRTGEGHVLNKSIELTALAHDGREFPVEITIWPIHVGKDVQFNAFIRDLTEKKNLEQQLLQSQKMETVGTLAGGIAHDLNNQLTPVRGYIDLLLQMTDPSHASYQLLTEASQSAQWCSEVVQRLTHFSRPAAQKKTVLMLSDVFKEFESSVDKFLPATIQLGFECEMGIWPIEANAMELHTVLMNLTVNARDAMSGAGRMTIKASNKDFDGQVREGLSRGPYTLISVADTGGGMPPEVMRRIFEPFFTTKEKGRGTGLGLAMVFKIIQDHGGWIDISSKVGEGSIFNIYLPAKPDAVVSQIKAWTGIPEHLLAKNETVLLVDDEEVVRKLGKTLLEKLGYKVLIAHDGVEALSIYQESHQKIDIVMTDMTMPKMTGLEVIQKVLKINPKAKIVIVSGYSLEGTSHELIKQGAAEFIQKPYTIMTLAHVLRKTLDQSSVPPRLN